jgi:hypothetical protein
LTKKHGMAVDYLTEEVWQHRWHGLHQVLADVEAGVFYHPTTALPFIKVGVVAAAAEAQRRSGECLRHGHILMTKSLFHGRVHDKSAGSIAFIGSVTFWDKS